MTRKVYTCSWMAITHWFVLYAASTTTHMTNMHYTNTHSSNSSNISNSVPGRGQRRAQPRGCVVCLDARCRYAMALQSAVWLPVVRCCCHSTAAPLLHVSVVMTRLLLDHPLVHSTTTQTLMSESSWQSEVSCCRKWSLCSFRSFVCYHRMSTIQSNSDSSGFLLGVPPCRLSRVCGVVWSIEVLQCLQCGYNTM